MTAKLSKKAPSVAAVSSTPLFYLWENWLPDTIQLWLLPQDIKKEEFCQNTLLKHVNLLLDIIAVIITYFTQTGKKTTFLDKNTLTPSNKHLNTITGEYLNSITVQYDRASEQHFILK